jgi:hypothetical protein
VRITLAILAGVTGGACFSPEIADGTIACGEAGCPEGMVCAGDGYCYATPPGADADSRVVLAVSNRDGNNRLYAYCRDALTPVWSDGDLRMNHALAWGDVHGDGVPELAIASGDDGVILYEIRDDGLASIGTESMPMARDVAWAQWDDGPRDIAVANPDGFRMLKPVDDYLEIEWQSGLYDGLAVAVADFDGDGWEDLAGGTRGESLGVFQSNGNDALSAMWWDDGGEAEAVAWGRADEDGDVDVVTSASGVAVYANRGDWFERTWSVDVDATALALANLDGDDDDDLAVGTGDGAALIVYENQDGTLVEVWRSEELDLTSSVAWGDLDGDGDPDLAAGNDGAPVRVYRNDGGALALAWEADDVEATVDVAWTRWSDGPDPCSW